MVAGRSAARNGECRSNGEVWDAASGLELQTLNGHTSPVNSVSWSSDGKRLATGSWDGTAKVWDLAGGRELHTLKGHTSRVGSVSWSPDGQRLATASDDATAKVWDAAGGRELLTLKGHTSPVGFVSWSSDGQRLATASYDGTVNLWDAATPTRCRMGPPGPRRSRPPGPERFPWSASRGIHSDLAPAAPTALGFGGGRCSALDRQQVPGERSCGRGLGNGSLSAIGRWFGGASVAGSGPELQCGAGTGGESERRLRRLLSGERSGARRLVAAGWLR